MKTIRDNARIWIECRQNCWMSSQHLQLLNCALQRGHSFSRWPHVANTIIFKEPGNIWIHRTRVIHYTRAITTSLLWGWSGGQHCMRPRRRDCGMRISMVHDPVVKMLMIHQINASALLQAQQYRIRMELGLADESYSHCQSNPIYGTGQGSGCSAPDIWWCRFLVSSSYSWLLWCQSMYKSKITRLGILGFVDDSNVQTKRKEWQLTSLQTEGVSVTLPRYPGAVEAPNMG